MKNFKLSNGNTIPCIGLGTWRSEPDKVYDAVLTAIEAGYRHIDAAMIYNNEEQVGKAIKDSGIKREELFVTTKLWNSDQGYETTKKALETSLEKLGLDYIDLYLIHWFKGYDKLFESYKAMEELYKEGKIKALGTSNFNVHHIMKLIEFAEIKPVVNQVETHIALQNQFLQEYCSSEGIQLEAYAPLMSSNISELLSNQTMNELAQKYNKTVPQVAIKWLLQRGIVALPKSVTPSRIIENFNVFDFEISSEDMDKIKTLNQGKKLFPEMDNVTF